MSQEFLRRTFFFSIMSLCFMLDVHTRCREDAEPDRTDKQRFLPIVGGYFLPLFTGLFWIIGALFNGVVEASRRVLSVCFTVFPHISLYYLLLIPLIPLLRKRFSARACAALWLCPNYLYLCFYYFLELPAPLLVITAPGKLVWGLLGLWFTGFLAVLIWKITEHLRFRRMVLKDAYSHPDTEARARLKIILAEGRFRNINIPLMVSPRVSTPLTLGLFKSTTVVMLPPRQYTREELDLILRHEVVHIGREDAWSKFFLVFCTAMCWFNPLMWVAMGKSADDLELSCDETVLLEADDNTRRQYARLILNTAGDKRGFTTCLSASAEALRYRLKHIMDPVIRRSGAAIVGLAFFLLSMTSGYVSLAYDGQTGADIIYQSHDPQNYSIRSIHPGDESDTLCHVSDEEGLHNYLAGLTMYRLTGNYSFSDRDRIMTVYMGTPIGRYILFLSDNGIQIDAISRLDVETIYYHIPEGIDWDYLDSILIVQPELNVWLMKEDAQQGFSLDTTMTGFWQIRDGEQDLLTKEPAPIHGPQGYDAEKAILQFSLPLAGRCTVLIDALDREESSTLVLEEPKEPLTLEVPDYPAQYTVLASFTDDNGNLYEAEFQFRLE